MMSVGRQVGNRRRLWAGGFLSPRSRDLHRCTSTEMTINLCWWRDTTRATPLFRDEGYPAMMVARCLVSLLAYGIGPCGSVGMQVLISRPGSSCDDRRDD